MKVKHLIEELQKLDQEATICLSTLASENALNIKDIKSDNGWVELRADDILFKLDENGLALIEHLQDEEAKQDAIDTMIDQALGK